MTTSSTYAYNPAVGDLIINAFARCQIRSPELTAQHLQDAATELNLLSVQFSNRNPYQYTLETPTITLIPGQDTYTLPNRILAIGIVYVTQNFGTGSAFDRPLNSISASDYGAIPNKTIQGAPTLYNFQLFPVPEIKFWPVPDANGTYVANVQSFRQQMDVSIVGGQTLDMPYRFIDAMTAGLAMRLARIYAPALYPMRKQDFEEAFQECSQADQADDTFFITPALQSYHL